MGIDPNTISIARGMAFGFNNDNNNALIVGLVMHLLTSTVIGIIFAILATKVNRLKITGYKKGIDRRNHNGNCGICNSVYSNNPGHDTTATPNTNIST